MKMTNIADHKIVVGISSMPGQPRMETPLEPGESSQFPDGYCKPVLGAGKDYLPSILERRYQHHGVPVLVPADRAEACRERYLKVKRRAELADNSPEATIRRLEAELAQAKAELARSGKDGVAKAQTAVQQRAAELEGQEPFYPPEDEDLTQATTPVAKQQPRRPGRSRKATEA